MIIDIEALNNFIKETEKVPMAHRFFKSLLDSERVIIVEIINDDEYAEMTLKAKDEIHIDGNLFSRGDVLELYTDKVEGDFDTFIEAKNGRTYGSEHIDFQREYFDL